MYTNADQYMNKRTELHRLLDASDNIPKIIGISEILPKNRRFEVDLVELQIEGYELFTNIGAAEDIRGTGLYIHNSLRPSAHDIGQGSPFSESVWASIQLNDENIIIGCLYRSPSSNVENNTHLCRIFSSLQNLPISNKIIIMGDFNFPKVDWKSCTCNLGIDSPEFAFLESTRDSFLMQMVQEPTRFRVGHEPSILDLIWTNDESLVDDLSHKAPLGASDHCVLEWSLNRQANDRTSTTIKKLYDKGDYERMKTILNIDWQKELDGLEINECWNKVKLKVKEAEAACIPTKKVQTNKRTKPIWMDNNTLRKVKKKHKAWNTYQNTYQRAKITYFLPEQETKRNGHREAE